MIKKLEQIVSDISTLSLLETVELIKLLMTKFGIDESALAVSTGGGNTETQEADAGPKLFSVIITTVLTSEKVRAIKLLREKLGIGLADAKTLLEKPCPITIQENMKRDEADALAAEIAAIGMGVEVK